MPNWKKVIVSGSNANLNSLTLLSGLTVTGSSNLSGSLTVSGSTNIVGTTGTTLFSSNADTLVFTGSFYISGSTVQTGSLNITSITSSLQGTASWAISASSALYAVSASYVPTSVIFPYTGSARITGSLDVIGTTTITGSLNISGSTTQIGNNTLLGNTTLSGSIIISGSLGSTPTVKIYGDTQHNGYIRFDPVTTNIDTSISASYIYVSGSTNDLYFSQNGDGYNNVTRLRWLESNLYTGILSGGVITSTPGSTTWNISSGSGIIVTQNASTASAPYPTVKFIEWGDITNIPITNSGSAKITYVGLDNTGTPVQQVVPWGSTDVNQFDTQINLGVVLHLSGSVSTGVFSSPQISYGPSQKIDDFTRAFGPLKISGHTLQASGSTLSIIKTGGSAYKEGANYRFNPNHPSTTVENDILTSKIYRYYISGSTPIIDTGIANAGYTVIDPTQRVNTATGALTSVATNKYSIQRVFWVPNSPTNAFIVYYGNAEYNSLIDAATNINTEPFTEAPNTAANAIFVGWIAVAGGASNLSNANEATIIQGGIFRNVGGIGSSGTSPLSNTLAGLSDVSIPGRTAGDLLYYNGSQWVNSKTFVGNYTISGSLTTNDGITAVSVTATSFTGSFTGSFVGLLTGTASYATNASTASHASTFTISSSLHSAQGVTFASPGGATTETIVSTTTGSYRAGFFDYTIYNSGNARAGTVMTAWNGSSVVYADNSTSNIGNTNNVTMSVVLNGGNAELKATANDSGGGPVIYWTVQTTYRLI